MPNISGPAGRLRLPLLSPDPGDAGSPAGPQTWRHGPGTRPVRDPDQRPPRRHGIVCVPGAGVAAARRAYRAYRAPGPVDAGVASATVTVGQQLGASIGTSLLNTIFAGAVTAYLTANLASAKIIGRQALTGLALAHGYDTAFWWTAGIFAAGAVIGGALLRPGPLAQQATPSPAHAEAPTAPAETDPALPA